VLYELAAATGFRFSECRSLTWSCARLIGNRPAITVLAAYSKHRRDDEQPVGDDLVSTLKARRSTQDTTGPQDPVFPSLKRWTIEAKLLRPDLEAAGIKYETEDGRVVFHCLRNTYITNLDRADVPPTTKQDLARHSDVRLTDRYSRSFVSDQYDAVNRLPSPHGRPESERLRATGTDDVWALKISDGNSDEISDKPRASDPTRPASICTGQSETARSQRCATTGKQGASCTPLHPVARGKMNRAPEDSNL
jgi:hypothetical protein